MLTMPTSCAVNRCTNNSNKGYAVFNFPSDVDLCQKWIAALGKSFYWRPSGFQRICEVHFDLKDLVFVAGRKQLNKDAVPRHFCMCPYNKVPLKNQRSKFIKHEDHTYSMMPFKTINYTKKLQLPSNILPRTYVPEQNYLAYIGKENGVYFIKNIPNDTRKNLDSVNSKRIHAHYCPSLKNPILIKQLLTESNMDKNPNKLDTDINLNESDMNLRKTLITKIDALSKDNENLKLQLNKMCATQTNKINAQEAKLKEVINDNKILRKQLETLTQQITNNLSTDKLTTKPYQYSNKLITRGLNLWTGTTILYN